MAKRPDQAIDESKLSSHQASTVDAFVREVTIPFPHGHAVDSAVPFPIVGIGASAGGLEAFKKFFSAFPHDSGIAFVLVPHLAPHHKSMMVELLSRNTQMLVLEAEHGTRVHPNTVYVIPPNHHISIAHGILQLSELETHRSEPIAIDHFLRSLAEDQLERSIGIIFSGTGSYGTQGIREIKRCGGMAIAQSPDTSSSSRCLRVRSKRD